jgi:hypothetical protein
MASVTAIYRYPTGEAVSVRVKVENDYPDALDQARATAIAGVRELTGIDTAEVEGD